MKHFVLMTVSFILSLFVLFFSLSWLFARVEGLRGKPVTQMRVPLKTPRPTAETKAQSETLSLTREETASASARAAGKGQSASRKKGFPAINIYYGAESIYDYIGFLAARGCLILVKSPLGSIFASYNPQENTVSTHVPKDFTGYSPRTRILAVFGENPVTDRIIEQAARISPKVLVPEGCQLMALSSSRWEQAIMEALKTSAKAQGMALHEVESAELTFSSSQLILTSLRTSSGAVFRLHSAISNRF